jgi:uncharacterized protein with PIN domain
MTMAKNETPRCPQCGDPLRHNDVGAWCENYPCRYVLNRDKVRIAAKAYRLMWGAIK